MLAIIGSRDLIKCSAFNVVHREVVRTPYGDPSSAFSFVEIDGQTVIFLVRHGHGVRIAPHEVNYRANLWALHSLGARDILSIDSVGCIKEGIVPGDLVLPDQLIDYTWGRSASFTDDFARRQIDFSYPYDMKFRQHIADAARAAGVPVKQGSTYAVRQGPRLETIAEANRLEQDGADMIGMSAMPEAILAQELALRYASISIIVNYAAGRGNNKTLDWDEMSAILLEKQEAVCLILSKLPKTIQNS